MLLHADYGVDHEREYGGLATAIFTNQQHRLWLIALEGERDIEAFDWPSVLQCHSPQIHLSPILINNLNFRWPYPSTIRIANHRFLYVAYHPLKIHPNGINSVK